MFEVITSLGLGSIHALWVPLGIWTILWMMAESVLWLSRDVHPGVRYRLTQAVVWALPLSIALTAWMPKDILPSSWAAPAFGPKIRKPALLN